MKRIFVAILIFQFFVSCSDDSDYEDDIRFLTLNDIKAAYHTADSLNNLEDRSAIDTATEILGVDKRNGKIVIRTCQTRAFGCLIFTDFYTIKYQECDSVCCEKNDGYWLVDYAGIVGSRSVVGCVPDTLQ